MNRQPYPAWKKKQTKPAPPRDSRLKPQKDLSRPDFKARTEPLAQRVHKAWSPLGAFPLTSDSWGFFLIFQFQPQGVVPVQEISRSKHRKPRLLRQAGNDI